MGTDDDSAVLLAEFRMWLDRERGLSPVSVRCYSKQAKYFLAAVGGPEAVSGLDAGKVTAFMVEHSRDRNSWSAKAMVTSLRAFLRFAHATGRTAVSLAGAVPAVASWRLSALPRGLSQAEIGRLLAGQLGGAQGSPQPLRLVAGFSAVTGRQGVHKQVVVVLVAGGGGLGSLDRVQDGQVVDVGQGLAAGLGGGLLLTVAVQHAGQHGQYLSACKAGSPSRTCPICPVSCSLIR